jgi:uncharacterized protein (DUF1684 family)
MLTLLDYRRRVSDLYAAIRMAGLSAETHAKWQMERDWLFANHPQSPLDEEQKSRFSGLQYYPYNPQFRVQARLQPVPTFLFEGDLGDDGLIRYQRIGRVDFTVPTGSGSLNVYWIVGYGGGLFLPFGDATNKTTTYGAGRYLYDTIKGADLGAQGDIINLDFNFAYHPSCAYNPHWVCPLAPAENRLSFPIPVGEMLATI